MGLSHFTLFSLLQDAALLKDLICSLSRIYIHTVFSFYCSLSCDVVVAIFHNQSQTFDECQCSWLSLQFGPLRTLESLLPHSLLLLQLLSSCSFSAVAFDRTSIYRIYYVL